MTFVTRLKNLVAGARIMLSHDGFDAVGGFCCLNQ